MTQTTTGNRNWKPDAPLGQHDAPVQAGTAIQIAKQVRPETLARWEHSGYPAARIALMQQQIAPTATLEELAYFIERCIASRLDPFKRQIYFVKRKDKNSPTGYSCAHQVGIDGFRSIAEDSQMYAGSDEPEFEGTVDIGGGKHAPDLARVTVWRIVQGVRCPFVGVARWAEFYPGEWQGGMWLRMPHNQLAKCAEAQGLRKGFPSKLGELELATEDRHRDGIGQIVDSALASVESRRPQYIQLPDGESVRAADEYQRLYGDEGNSESTRHEPRTPQPVRREAPQEREAAYAEGNATAQRASASLSEVIDAPPEPPDDVEQTEAQAAAAPPFGDDDDLANPPEIDYGRCVEIYQTETNLTLDKVLSRQKPEWYANWHAKYIKAKEEAQELPF